ncbi:MAG: CDP-glycerol glycerophosphotransferase family protein [Lachnospiraceae bacterium]|nr:CDP-glycerol glycerophosphotransferase family protein [Lachnospiraceae bacterium]
MKEIIFEVTKLEWERIFLKLDIKTAYTGKVRFRLESIGKFHRNREKEIIDIDVKKKVPLKYESYENGTYHLEINIVAADKRTFLENGRWRIMAVTPHAEFMVYVSYPVAYKLDDCSRIFRYGGGKYAYNMSFSTRTEDEEHLWFMINSYFMIRNQGWSKRHYVQEALTFKGKFRRMHRTIVIFLINLFYQFWEPLFPKRGKNILIMSETKDYLWGNLKYIDRRIKERGLNKKFRVRYNFRKAVGTHMSALSWMKLVFKIAQQDYIFVDDYVPVFGFLELNKRTKLIQVWHAGEGFKAVGYCRFGKEGTPFPVGNCHKKYNYVLTGSQKLVKVFSEVFGIEEEAFLPVGMPRLDGFLDKKKIATFKKEFYTENPNLKNKKIIMFAPTYRGKGQGSAYYDYSWIDLDEIYDFCGDEYIFMVKMHPFTKKPIEIPEEYMDRIIDFSEYPNINDLYYVTDILITDYSSNYFEYSLLRRPVIFFTPDREIYELSRGVHRSVKESAPGPVCDTFEEMMDVLRKKDYQIEKIHQFVKDNFANYDGHATDRAINTILLKQKLNDEKR